MLCHVSRLSTGEPLTLSTDEPSEAVTLQDCLPSLTYRLSGLVAFLALFKLCTSKPEVWIKHCTVRLWKVRTPLFLQTSPRAILGRIFFGFEAQSLKNSGKSTWIV